MRWRLVLGACLALVPAVAGAIELTLPSSARQLTDRVSVLDSYDLPVAPYADQTVPVRRFEGRVQRRSWRVDGGAITTLQVLTPLREQIEAAGYELVFECRDIACGGFDFRFDTDVIPAPDMHVDIRNYRFLSAVSKADAALSVLVSRSRSAAYIQIVQVTPIPGQADEIPQQPDVQPAPVPPDAGGVVADLVAHGHVILDGLSFETGAATLGNGPDAALQALATYLEATPGQRIALVGHTDSAGSLSANISLSKRRAAAVRQRLVEKFGVDPGRIDAEGMGYLAPIASNLTTVGRETNRRVEAILLSAR